MTEREKTINSKGEIVTKPYGPSRWAAPRKYACKHEGCQKAAKTLKVANAHGDAMAAHNCCGEH